MDAEAACAQQAGRPDATAAGPGGREKRSAFRQLLSGRAGEARRARSSQL